MRAWLKHYFIPHEGNNYRPNFLERFSMGIMLFLVLLSFTIANLQSLLWINSNWMVSTILPAIIVDLTNEERGGGHIQPLARNEALDRAAQLKAEDMATNGYFAHYSPRGVSPWYWFDQVSYTFVHAGENLAVHFTDSDEVVEAWMESPTHRANIMNGNYTEIGIGTAKGTYKGAPTIFVVQLFGTPAAPQTAEPVVVAEEMPVPQEEDPTPVPQKSEAEPEVVEVVEEPEPVMEEGSTVMYSDLATTSRLGIPAFIGRAEAQTLDTEVTALEKSTIESGIWLKVLYGALALIVLVSLILSIIIEWRKQHLMQVAYAGGLLVVMALLLYAHATLTSGVTIV